ncbi:Gly-Xaa carboxypeptidase [Aspergillus clavatus NRRL 1]|uniref:Vacuolar carboxypeptidase Cps1, putative n=1 Tax=Aspergillus clavatus (strain ATCC 1007 / CBS 513.65 / DSM 816 / NCTC 3887 / NRRL 1 / QM 1276 / 107) TaxID=344612 RepID=A1CJH3_ASPCL|nr:vacuolar carboxypeptidase Cps1, putative [Aspergillus clavatus NRRL 1]EAW09297.1 vacuolar carboxypeptidase Cps1, putative [Aspergillus clavatus NRRL 1]
MRSIAHIIPALVGFGIPSAMSFSIPSPQQILESFSGTGNEICPQASKVSFPEDGLLSALRFVQDEAVRSQQAERLSKAIQVPTTVNDYMTDPYDEGFAPFVEFQELLESLFPLLHSRARVDHVNRLGLLFTVNGTDDSLKPLLFMAHQDVVPINDPSDWTYPPFAGHFDGEFIWGRGASDCKNVLISLLSVIEDLLHQDWQPARTVVLAFGFDEESKGFLGAGHLSAALEQRYGRDSFEFILDEGGMGLETLGDNDDIIYALPGVGEKGYIDIVFALDVTGGHSSIPPPHTGIGIMSEIIYTLERQDLFVPVLNDEHPSRRKLECQARYSPDYVEPWLASALRSSDHAAVAEKLAVARGDMFRFNLQTSQAADIFHGGIKSNALPEKISALVNYRVALHQTPEVVKQRAIDIIRPIAEKHNLTWSAFEDPATANEEPAPRNNHLALSILSTPLDPAPTSPTNVSTDAVWARFAGVARTSFESVPSLKGKTVVVSGDIMGGNTDTRFYWSLSRNIYRWSPARKDASVNIHTVDERMSIDAHLEAMVLYYNLIRSFDSWKHSAEVVADL